MNKIVIFREIMIIIQRVLELKIVNWLKLMLLLMMHNINHMEYMSNNIIHNITRRKKYMIMLIIYIIRMIKMKDRLFKTDPVILITLFKSKDMNITKLTINK